MIIALFPHALHPLAVVARYQHGLPRETVESFFSRRIQEQKSPIQLGWLQQVLKQTVSAIFSKHQACQSFGVILSHFRFSLLSSPCCPDSAQNADKQTNAMVSFLQVGAYHPRLWNPTLSSSCVRKLRSRELRLSERVMGGTERRTQALPGCLLAVSVYSVL